VQEEEGIAGIRGRAHRGQEQTGRWLPGIDLAGGLSPMAEVVLRCFPGHGKRLRRHGSTSRSFWLGRFDSAAPQAKDRRRPSHGGRHGSWPAAAQEGRGTTGGARQGLGAWELGHMTLSRRRRQEVRGTHAQERRRRCRPKRPRPLAARAPLGPDGFRRAYGWAGADLGRAFRLGPVR
jgi:hypothetical protein